jgi:hypothetical protein
MERNCNNTGRQWQALLVIFLLLRLNKHVVAKKNAVTMW